MGPTIPCSSPVTGARSISQGRRAAVGAAKALRTLAAPRATPWQGSRVLRLPWEQSRSADQATMGRATSPLLQRARRRVWDCSLEQAEAEDANQPAVAASAGGAGLPPLSRRHRGRKCSGPTWTPPVRGAPLDALDKVERLRRDSSSGRRPGSTGGLGPLGGAGDKSGNDKVPSDGSGGGRSGGTGSLGSLGVTGADTCDTKATAERLPLRWLTRAKGDTGGIRPGTTGALLSPADASDDLGDSTVVGGAGKQRSLSSTPLTGGQSETALLRKPQLARAALAPVSAGAPEDVAAMADAVALPGAVPLDCSADSPPPGPASGPEPRPELSGSALLPRALAPLPVPPTSAAPSKSRPPPPPPLEVALLCLGEPPGEIAGAAEKPPRMRTPVHNSSEYVCCERLEQEVLPQLPPALLDDRRDDRESLTKPIREMAPEAEQPPVQETTLTAARIDSPLQSIIKKVRFCDDGDELFEAFTPYGRIYGQHPSAFVFDKAGNKVPASPLNSVDLSAVDVGSLLYCTAKISVDYRTQPHLTARFNDLRNLVPGALVHVEQRDGDFVRDEVGWLPLFISDVPVFEVAGAGESMLEAGPLRRRGAIALQNL